MRLALFCTHDACMWRQFDDPNARCPDHPSETAVQRNRPYMGRELEQPQVPGLRVVDATEKPKARRGRG